MKNLLIISPYFPPSNTADMQRIRMSLPYFRENNWKAEVVMVDDKHSETVKDNLLLENINSQLTSIHKVKAFPKKLTSKFGLGSLGLRSIYFYKNFVNKLLEKKKYDLIYFSTTEFAVTILGPYWKKKYLIPYVIDMQDPWHTDYYQDKPKAQRPPKYWFSYRMNKYLEPIAMKNVDGLISVSQGYIESLQARYPNLKNVPHSIITFGAYQTDFDFVKNNSSKFTLPYVKLPDTINVAYVGRGGHDMSKSISLLFSAFKEGLSKEPSRFKKLRFHFIGTSYAPAGKGTLTIKPLADQMGIGAYVNELTDRIPFYESLYTLINSDALLVIGSNDSQYTASKLYPYILAEKPLLAFLHPDSSAAQIIHSCNIGEVISILEDHQSLIYQKLIEIIQGQFTPVLDRDEFNKYSAKAMTRRQCKLFNEILIDK